MQGAQHPFVDLDAAWNAYRSLIVQLNDVMTHLEHFESFVRSEEGQMFTLGGDVDMAGHRLRNLPQSRNEDEPIPRKEMRQAGVYASGVQPLRIAKQIIAERGVISPDGRTQTSVINLSQLRTFLAALAAINIPQDVADAGALGSVTLRLAREDHVHSGLDVKRYTLLVN